MVVREIPVALETVETPPRPKANASQAAQRRRSFSFIIGAKVSNLSWTDATIADILVRPRRSHVLHGNYTKIGQIVQVILLRRLSDLFAIKYGEGPGSAKDFVIFPFQIFTALPQIWIDATTTMMLSRDKVYISSEQIDEVKALI